MIDCSKISDAQIEAACIATLIAHPDFLAQFNFLKAKHFYQVENGCLYWAIEQLYQNGINHIDAMNLTNMLNSNSAVHKTMEAYNLGDMQEYINLSRYAARDTLEEYRLLAGTVLSYAYKRDLIDVTVKTQKWCQDHDKSATQIDVELQHEIARLSESYVIQMDNGVQMYSDKVDDIWTEIVNRRKRSQSFVNKFKILDEYFTYEPGELYLISGRMKRGKSAWMMNQAITLIQSGVPLLYLDSEMTDYRFHERMLANLTGIEVQRVRNGTYSKDESKLIAETNEKIKKYPFVHMYTPEFTDDQIYATVKNLKYKMDLKFVVYDYIKSNLLSSAENANYLGEKADFLKNTVAGQEGIVVLAGAQLGRTNMVADSDKIERAVTVSMYWREKTHEEIQQDGLECGNFCLNVGLNRMGEQMDPDAYLDFVFDAPHMRIAEAKQQHNPQETNPFVVQ